MSKAHLASSFLTCISCSLNIPTFFLSQLISVVRNLPTHFYFSLSVFSSIIGKSIVGSVASYTSSVLVFLGNSLLLRVLFISRNACKMLLQFSFVHVRLSRRCHLRLLALLYSLLNVNCIFSTRCK